jgi:hypothetical protein
METLMYLIPPYFPIPPLCLHNVHYTLYPQINPASSFYVYINASHTPLLSDKILIFSLYLYNVP